MSLAQDENEVRVVHCCVIGVRVSVSSYPHLYFLSKQTIMMAMLGPPLFSFNGCNGAGLAQEKEDVRL